MQFSILRLKSPIARANSCWSIVSNSCRMASFNSSRLRGLWVYTRPFRYPQTKKSHDDKSGDLGPSDGRFHQAKDWKLHSRWHYFSYLNTYLKWHVLTFNFVKITPFKVESLPSTFFFTCTLKIQENLSNGSRVVICGRADRTERQEEANISFPQFFRKRLKIRQLDATPKVARKQVILKKKTRWKGKPGPHNQKPASGPRHQTGFIHRP